MPTTLYLCLSLAAVDVPPDGSWTLQLFPLTGDAAKALVHVEGVQALSTYSNAAVRKVWGEMLGVEVRPTESLVSPARVKLTGNAPIHFLVLQDEAHVMLVVATPNNQHGRCVISYLPEDRTNIKGMRYALEEAGWRTWVTAEYGDMGRYLRYRIYAQKP